MTLLDGVSECWWLSRTCVVNWDAWAAIGTVAAVFAAILAPSIQRRFVRKKTNALFALAYQSDMAKALARMETLRSQFPLSPDRDDAWAVHASIHAGAPSCNEYLALIAGLEAFSSREIDVARWAAVDLDLAGRIATAIESLRHFQFGAMTTANTPPDDDWNGLMRSVDFAERLAYQRISGAMEAVSAALRRSKMNSIRS